MRWLIPLLLWAALPAGAQGVDAMSSILLVSKEDMKDPFFHHAVVLVTHRVGPGPMGVILNKPTRFTVADTVPGAQSRPKDERVFFGGPVAAADFLVIFRAADPPEGSIEILAGVYIAVQNETIRQVLAREPPIRELRVYAGYSGWARGQLENEVGRNDWHLLRAEAANIFSAKPEGLWRELERQGASKATSAPSPATSSR